MSSEGKKVLEAASVMRVLSYLHSKTEKSFNGAAKKEQQQDEEQDEVEEIDLNQQVMYLHGEMQALRRRAETLMPISLVELRFKEMKKELQDEHAAKLPVVKEELYDDLVILLDNHKKQVERKIKASDDKMRDDLEAAQNAMIQLCKEQDKKHKLALSEFKAEVNLVMDKDITSMTAMHKDSSDKQKVALTAHISQIQVQLEDNMSQTGIQTAEYEARMGKFAQDMKKSYDEHKQEREQEMWKMKQEMDGSTKKFMDTLSEMAKANKDNAQHRVLTEARRSVEPHTAKQAHNTSLSRRTALLRVEDERRGVNGSSPPHGSERYLSDEEGSEHMHVESWLEDAEHGHAAGRLQTHQRAVLDDYDQHGRVEATIMELKPRDVTPRSTGVSASRRHNSGRGQHTTLQDVDFGEPMQRSAGGSVSGRSALAVRSGSTAGSTAGSVRGDVRR